jgi:hypothetical protein
MIAMRWDSVRREKKLRVANRASTQVYALPMPFDPSRSGIFDGRVAFLWAVCLALALATLLLMPRPASAQEPEARSYQLYVPAISTAGPGGTGSAPEECALNAEETTLAGLVVGDPGQQRDNPVCDPVLAQVARARARDMALRGYLSHTNPDGDGPNLLVREAGYRLPDWYGDKQNSNNIESIGGGHTSANAAFQGWLNSPAHRTHVLGTQSFYADQEAYGVGYYYNADSPLKHYWVFLSAPLPE